MTTIREIITDAFRENNLISVGDVPDGGAYLEAESLLLEFISSLFETELGETLTSIYIDKSSDYIPTNSRVIITQTSPNSIVLPSEPSDGEQFSVVDPRGLLTYMTVTTDVGTIENSESVILDSSESEYHWFYRADKADWARVSPLTSEDESPFPPVFNDMLRLWLAFRIAPRNGASTKAESLQVQERIVKKFTSRYKQKKKVGSELGLLVLTSDRTSAVKLNWHTGY